MFNKTIYKNKHKPNYKMFHMKHHLKNKTGSKIKCTT